MRVRVRVRVRVRASVSVRVSVRVRVRVRHQLLRLHSVLGTGVAHGTHQALHRLELRDGLRIHWQLLLGELRPRRDHEAVAVVRQPLPELLRDIGHEGVQQPQAGVEHVHQRAPRLARARLRLVDMARLGEGG